MTTAALDARMLAAQAFARTAGAEARRYFRNFDALNAREKAVNDLVTSADLAVDRRLRAELSAAFPDDAFLIEESGAGGGAGDGLWVIDPIDGTGNFARGIAHFAISIAFCTGGVVEIGVIYDVMADEMFVARRGGGAFCNDLPVQANGRQNADAALIDAGYSSRHPIDHYFKRVQAMLAEGFEFSQCGSAALGLAYVACGRLDGFWELDLFSWDALAGMLLVREAGGWTSGFPLDDGLLTGRPVLACATEFSARLSRITGI